MGGGLLERERILLLVDSPKRLVQLVEAGVPISEVNVGGMHFRAGKNQITPFIFVDEEDVSNFRILHDKGIKLEGRDVPTRTPIDIARALRFEPI
ncbi:MAG: Fructose-specific phosphotransferase enzyme IIB component [bacterium ADurb.Bin431]|nr:MAG: Fructose-specific phosphotransferase enzyme IIB component [bacterium ADurb.Bin431]